MNFSPNQIQTKDPLRIQVLETTARFKAGWAELAQLLTIVSMEKKYLDWGFNSFDEYCRKEIRIRRATAEKLTGAWNFIKAEIPEDKALEEKTDGSIPELATVELLRKAKTNPSIKLDQFDTLKKMAFDQLQTGNSIQKKFKEFAGQIEELPNKDPNQGDLYRAYKLSGDLKRLLAQLKADEDVCVALQKVYQYLDGRVKAQQVNLSPIKA